MEIRWSVLLLMMGASIVTLLPRVIPLVVLSRLNIPDWAMRWLRYVPIAVMAALIGQEVLITEGKLTPVSTNLELLAAIPTILTALLTRSLLWTVITGIASMMAIRFFFG